MTEPLRPAAGFNPLQISWGGPDQTRTTICSYCDAPLGDPEDDDYVGPLITWDERGWCAEFCAACQRRWFGMELLCDDTEDDDEAPELGACCVCARVNPPAALVMLDVKGTVPGHGWGCVVCDLPPDGASAVICRHCLLPWESGDATLRFACRGWPAQDGRVAIDELTSPHQHDPTVSHA